MTIGPEPMIRIFEMSVRLGIALHQLEKLLEQIVRVVRTRRCFRMVLHAKRGNRSVFHSFDSIVIQIEVSDFYVVRVQTFRVDGESVILCRDLHLLPLEIQNRMVSAMVTKLQFVGASAKRQTHDLMTEA